MNKVSYIAFDLETGGVNAKINPILTGYFLLLDDNLEAIADLSLKVCPEAPFDVVEPEALAVSGIDLEKHLKDPNTVSRDEASKKLKDFISAHKEKKNQRIKIVGYNINFDIKMITEQLMPQEEWEALTHYTNIDVLQTVNFLKLSDVFPDRVGKLSTVVEHLGLPLLKAHDAEFDVKMTVEVLKKLKTMVKEKMRSSSMGIEDILKIIER